MLVVCWINFLVKEIQEMSKTLSSSLKGFGKTIEELSKAVQKRETNDDDDDGFSFPFGDDGPDGKKPKTTTKKPG